MKQEPVLTWKGRRVRSEGDSPETTARKVPPAPLRPGSLFFVPSPLEGWGLDILLERLSEGVVVVLEKDPDLRRHCQSAFDDFLGSRTSDPRLFWLEADNEEAVAALFARLPLERLRRCEFLTLNGAWLIDAPRYRQVFTRLEEGVTRWWSNRMTSVYLGPLWVRNLFDNLKSSATWFAPWPQWDDDPVLVCGAGVSLESVLPWVSARRRSWRILAVDTALSILKSWSLIPDAVVCLEAQHANLRDFSGWSGTPVPLFADLTSFPPTTRIFEKPPHWFISEFAPLSLWSRWPWDAEVPRLPPLGSVGVVAAWIAWRLTRGPVVLAGLDFSFPPGQSHARGAPSLSALASRTDRFRPMEQPESWERPGLYRRQGMRWLTTPVMEGYAGLLSQEAASYAHRTWVWKKEGFPLGLPVWEEESSRPALPERRVLGAKAQDRPSDWLSQERKRWDKILENFTLLNASPEDDSVWNLLEAKLREVDYLTFSFPDPQPRRTSDWLIRALTQVRWIVNRLSAGG